MSTWNGSPQRELTTNPLSGKLGADHNATERDDDLNAYIQEMTENLIWMPTSRRWSARRRSSVSTVPRSPSHSPPKYPMPTPRRPITVGGASAP